MDHLDDLNDEELVLRLMAGDRYALAPLVERYHGPLFGYLYRLTNADRALADDLVQESFIHVFKQGSYQPGKPFKPWLYSIATHLAYDYFRSPASRLSQALVDPVEAQLVDRAPGPEERSELASEARQIMEALRQVGEEYRAALLLRFFSELSLLEISQTLQIPLGTVKSRLSVGVRRLHAVLTRLETGEER